MNTKISVLFSLGMVFGWMSFAMSMQKPKLAILDRIDKLEKEVSELNKYRGCLTRICPEQV